MIRSNSNSVYMPSARVVAIIARKLLKVSDRHNVGEKYPKAESNRCRAQSEAFKGNSGPIPEGMARQKRRGSKYRASPVRGAHDDLHHHTRVRYECVITVITSRKTLSLFRSDSREFQSKLITNSAQLQVQKDVIKIKARQSSMGDP